MSKSGRNSRLMILITNPIPFLPCKEWPYLAPYFIKRKYKPASLSQTHLVRKKHTNKDAFTTINIQNCTFRQNQPMGSLFSQVSYIMAHKMI
jgi:hypothetical protein